MALSEGLREVLSFGGELAGARPEEMEQLGALLLALPDSAATVQHFRSTLNNDGSPLQICASLSSTAPRIRVIADPAAIFHPQVRFERASATCAELIRRQRCGSFKTVLQQLLSFAARNLESSTGDDHVGTFWLAAGPTDGSLAIYVSARWGDEATRWTRVQEMTEMLLPHREPAARVIGSLRAATTPAALAFEGSSLTDARVKIYWRLKRVTQLRELGVKALSDPSVRDFLRAVVCEDAIPAAGLIMSAGFALADGSLREGKLDLCCHCLPRTPSAWANLIRERAARNRLEHLALVNAIEKGVLEMALIGLAIGESRRRLNVYLKARRR